jgi:hypothetical protein
MGFCRMRRRKGGSSAAPFPAPLSPADAASLASHPAVRKEIQPRNQNSSPGRQFGWCYQLRYCGIQISSVAGHAPTNGGEPWNVCKLLILWWPGTESNRRRQPFQGCALPAELPGRSWGDFQSTRSLPPSPKNRSTHLQQPARIYPSWNNSQSVSIWAGPTFARLLSHQKV